MTCDTGSVASDLFCRLSRISRLPHDRSFTATSPGLRWIKALERCVEKALETGTVLHFWFHPSCDPVNVEKVFPALLNYMTARRADLWVTTMTGLVDSLRCG